MDHIVRCMLDADPSALDAQPSGYIEKAVSPSIDLQEQQQQLQCPTLPPAEDKPFAWRMHAPSDRKYQLFPKDKQQQPLAPGKGLDPEQAFALAMGQNSNGNGSNTSNSTSGTSGTNGNAGDKSDKSTTQTGNGLRLRIKEHTLIRRRKVSVPELGPMTTVQEVAMDSPTIPGRPPLHERSISAPGNSWKQQHHLVECMIPQPAYDEIPEQTVDYGSRENSSPLDPPRCNSAQAVLSPSGTNSPTSAGATISSNTTSITSTSIPPSTVTTTITARTSVRQPLSPKSLAPLVIPPPQSHHMLRPSITPHSSQSSRFRSGSTPVESALRSARSEESPRTRTPFTPLSASILLTTPKSAASAASTIPTPVSASTTTTTATIQLPSESSRTSPKPWTEGKQATVSTPKESVSKTNATGIESTPKTTTAAATANAAGSVTPAPVETPEPRSAPPRSASTLVVKTTGTTAPTSATIMGHRRGQSESGTGSIMERGRPRKRSASREGSTSAVLNAMAAANISVSATTAAASASTSSSHVATSTSASSSSSGLKRSASKASKSAERRAFELLPRGWKASEAPAVLGNAEVAALATQALQQAARFEVLRKEDVDSLSRELRNLDERTEYLRRTYTSLRAGRRNLHSRICQYLRSPRVAKFSHDSMLKQEEALAELDTSIDDWVTKLEQAENRRTRVRQKLLEHVAAAATLPLSSSLAATVVGVVPAMPSPSVVGVSETLQLAMGIKPPSPPYANNNNNGQQQHIATPPRSPTKMSFQNPSAAVPSIISPVAASPSPQRPIVAQVPSTILEQPLVEEAMASLGNAAAGSSKQHTSTATLDTTGSRRIDVESIRIYAGDDVYALLADVENQITQMGAPVAGTLGGRAPASAPPVSAYDYFSIPKDAELSDEERKQLHRAHSQELLNGKGGSNGGSKRATPSPPASPRAVSPADSTEIFLTSAVFRPERSVQAA